MKIKKIISILLAVLMLFSVVSVSAFAAENKSVSIYFTMSSADNKIQKHKMTVASGTAKKYGYSVAEKDHNNVSVNGVTVFDAIVAAHEELYGNSFTAETKESYLVMGSGLESGFIKKSFGKATSSSGFVVNGYAPNDGIINPAWGSYTGYSSDTAVLKDGDDVCYFFYQDSWYMDSYSWFDSNEYKAEKNEEITLTVKGYCAAYYSVNDWQTITDKYAKPLEEVSIYTYSGSEKVLLGKTDENGQLKVSFDNDGTYVIFTDGEDADEIPVITTYSQIIVSSKKPSALDKLKSIFESIIEFIKSIFKMFVK